MEAPKKLRLLPSTTPLESYHMRSIESKVETPVKKVAANGTIL